MRKSEVFINGKYLTRVSGRLALVRVTGYDRGEKLRVVHAGNNVPLPKPRTPAALRHTKGSFTGAYRIPQIVAGLRALHGVKPFAGGERLPKPPPVRKPPLPREPSRYHVMVSCRSIVKEHRAWIAKTREALALRGKSDPNSKAKHAAYLREKLRKHLWSRATYIAVTSGRLHASQDALLREAVRIERSRSETCSADSDRVARMMGPGTDPTIVEAIMGGVNGS